MKWNDATRGKWSRKNGTKSPSEDDERRRETSERMTRARWIFRRFFFVKDFWPKLTSSFASLAQLKWFFATIGGRTSLNSLVSLTPGIFDKGLIIRDSKVKPLVFECTSHSDFHKYGFVIYTILNVETNFRKGSFWRTLHRESCFLFLSTKPLGLIAIHIVTGRLKPFNSWLVTWKFDAKQSARFFFLSTWRGVGKRAVYYKVGRGVYCKIYNPFR